MARSAVDTKLIPIETAKRWLGIQPGSVSPDQLLAQLIVAASAAISQYCQRKFEQAIHTAYLTPDGSTRLFLPHWPVTSPMAVGHGVWVDSTYAFASSSALIEQVLGSGTAGDFLIEPGEDGQGIMHRAGGWGSAPGSIKAIWQAGYEIDRDAASPVDDIPFPIADACSRLVDHFYQVQKTHPLFQSIAVPGGGGSLSIPVDFTIPKDIKERLDPYRQWGFI